MVLPPVRVLVAAAAPITFSTLVIVSLPPKVPTVWAAVALRLTVTDEVEAE